MTIGKYAFSFDRETFRGSFQSRFDAIAAAMHAAGGVETDPPTSVYVACRVPLDPHAAGHGEALVERMRSAVRKELGADNDVAEEFLRRVSDQEMADLDDCVERAIAGWLSKHDLLPAGGKFSSISEHPVPLISGVARHGLGDREVSLIGESE